ncbi:MAG: hypothetical protein IKO20_04925 [Bacteroidaceae bacterium]|nr:hypothetical protein [Bacteroidaceae bacterium]
MVQKLRSIVLIVIGIIAIGLSIKCFTIDDLDWAAKSMYGGDAYTGIQNAAAVTSRNVMELASIVQFGFGSILLVMGLGFVGLGLTTPMGTRQDSAETLLPISDETVTETIQETPEEENTEA